MLAEVLDRELQVVTLSEAQDQQAMKEEKKKKKKKHIGLIVLARQAWEEKVINKSSSLEAAVKNKEVTGISARVPGWQAWCLPQINSVWLDVC